MLRKFFGVGVTGESFHIASRSALSKPKRKMQRPQLSLETLEPRIVPAWTALGPNPQLDPEHLFASAGEQVTGRVSAVAIDQVDSTHIFVVAGTASGGIYRASLDLARFKPGDTVTWRSATINSANTAVPLTGPGRGGILRIGSLAVDAVHPMIMYAGTGEANYSGGPELGGGVGILKSIDFGETWTLLPNSEAFGDRQAISKIVINPFDTQQVFASVVSPSGANGRGLFRSNNGGVDWVRINTAEIVGGGPLVITDMAYASAGRGSEMLIIGVGAIAGGGSNGVWKGALADDGTITSWSRLLLGINVVTEPDRTKHDDGNSIGRIALAYDSPNGLIYAAVAQPGRDTTLRPEIYKTTLGNLANPETAWDALPVRLLFTGPGAKNPIAFGNQAFYDLALAVDSAGNLYLGGANYVATSVNGGRSWVSTIVTNKPSPHADQHAFAFFQGSRFTPPWVVDGNDGGVYLYQPTGAKINPIGTWTNLNGRGLDDLQIYSLTENPTNLATYIAGSQDNGFAITFNSGTAWTTIKGGDGLRAVFASANVYYLLNQKGRLSRGILNGQKQTLTGASPPGAGDSANFAFNAPFAVDPADPNRILIAGTNAVFESTDGGKNWGRVLGVADTGTAIMFGAAPAAGFTPFYVATSAGRLYSVQRLQDGAGGQRVYAVAIRQTGLNGSITSIAIDPSNANRLFLTVNSFDQDQVLFSDDAGTTFNQIVRAHVLRGPGDFPSIPAYTLVVAPDDGDTVYVGSDEGVYRGVRQDNGTWNWDRFSDNMPNVTVDALQIIPNGATEFLSAGTFGRGAWIINIPTMARAAVEVTTGGDQAAIEGASTSYGLGSFSDRTSGATLWTVDVDWGDGAGHTTFTTISQGMLANMIHTYGEEGSYTVRVKVTDNLNVMGSATFTVSVADPAVVAVPVKFGATVNSALTNQALATFTDPGGPEPNSADPIGAIANNYGATIDWGDNSAPSTGTITVSNGVFTVRGSHTYSSKGQFTTTVAVFHEHAQPAQVSGTVTVSAAPSGYVPGPFTDVTSGMSSWTVDRNWEDGTAHTSFTTNSQGTLANKSDAHGPESSYTVTVKRRAIDVLFGEWDSMESKHGAL